MSMVAAKSASKRSQTGSACPFEVPPNGSIRLLYAAHNAGRRRHQTTPKGMVKAAQLQRRIRAERVCVRAYVCMCVREKESELEWPFLALLLFGLRFNGSMLQLASERRSARP